MLFERMKLGGSTTRVLWAAKCCDRTIVVLSFWIGPLDDDGLAAPDAQKRWWSKDPELDRTCAERFGELQVLLDQDTEELIRHVCSTREGSLTPWCN